MREKIAKRIEKSWFIGQVLNVGLGIVFFDNERDQIIEMPA